MDFCAPSVRPIATLYNYYANENQRYVVKTLAKMFHNIKNTERKDGGKFVFISMLFLVSLMTYLGGCSATCMV